MKNIIITNITQASDNGIEEISGELKKIDSLEGKLYAEETIRGQLKKMNDISGFLFDPLVQF